MIETRKSSGIFFASAAAAAVTPAKIRLHEVSRRVLNFSVRNVVLHGINQFDVSDRVRRLFHESSHAFIALAAQTRRPIHGSCRITHFFLPILAYLRQKIGPDVGSAASLRPVNHNDIGVRKFHAPHLPWRFPYRPTS